MPTSYLSDEWVTSTKAPACDRGSVAVRQVGTSVHVRNDDGGAEVVFTLGAWERFREGVLAGGFVSVPTV